MAQNSITVVGNVVRPPELKNLASGSTTVRFTVAINRKVSDREQTSYFDVTAFGSLAENVASCLDKGTRVIVSGRLEQRSWEDKDGNKRSATEIIAEAVGPDLRFQTVTYGKASQRYGSGDGILASAGFEEHPF